MKKKEIKKEVKKEDKKENIILTFEPANTESEWLLGLLALTSFAIPKSESKTTINIYTGSDK